MKFITRHYIIIIISFIFLLSCKKEIEEIPESNTPVFTIEGIIAGEEISVYVDEETSSFLTEEEKINGVSFFKGTLIGAGFELEIGLFDGNIDKSTLSLDDISKFSNLSFLKAQETDLFYANKYYFNNPQNIASIDWYVNDQFYCSNAININKPGRYTICAHINYLNGSNRIVCNEVILGFKKNAVFSLEYQLNQNNQLDAWIYEDNVMVESIDWYVDGVYETSDLVLHKVLNNEVHEVKANIQFQNGAKRTRTIIVDGNQDQNSIIDFAFLENLSNLSCDYHAKIIYRENGEIFNSELGDNSQSEFELLDISYLGKDQQGNDVYKISANLKANLKSSSTLATKPLNLKISWGLVLK